MRSPTSEAYCTLDSTPLGHCKPNREPFHRAFPSVHSNHYPHSHHHCTRRCHKRSQRWLQSSPQPVCGSVVRAQVPGSVAWGRLSKDRVLAAQHLAAQYLAAQHTAAQNTVKLVERHREESVRCVGFESRCRRSGRCLSSWLVLDSSDLLSSVRQRTRPRRNVTFVDD